MSYLSAKGYNLEYRVMFHSEASPLEKDVIPIRKQYQNNIYSAYSTSTTIEYVTQGFLNPLRPVTRFINSLDSDLRDILERTFKSIFNSDFPDCGINVLNSNALSEAHRHHGGNWNSNILGFAINETNEIFVLNDNLDKLLITIGHELGHILSPTLPNPHDEEAKAFAFQQHWIKTITEHNIGNLQHHFILPKPAENGLHNIAFGFVLNMIQSGSTAFDVFSNLASGNLSVGGLNV